MAQQSLKKLFLRTLDTDEFSDQEPTVPKRAGSSKLANMPLRRCSAASATSSEAASQGWHDDEDALEMYSSLDSRDWAPHFSPNDADRYAAALTTDANGSAARVMKPQNLDLPDRHRRRTRRTAWAGMASSQEGRL